MRIGRHKRILLVDDDPDTLALLRTELSVQYNVVTARNGVEALKKMCEVPIDIIITDIYMPEMDGIELIKQVTVNYQIKILAMSGYSDRILNSAIENGATAVLRKPFNLKDLNEVLESFVA